MLISNQVSKNMTIYQNKGNIMKVFVRKELFNISIILKKIIIFTFAFIAFGCNPINKNDDICYFKIENGDDQLYQRVINEIYVNINNNIEETTAIRSHDIIAFSIPCNLQSKVMLNLNNNSDIEVITINFEEYNSLTNEVEEILRSD